MGVGLEVYADGDFELGNEPYFKDLYAYILGTVSATSSGSHTDAGLLDGDPWFMFVANSFNTMAHTPIASIAGDTITWTANPKGTFIGSLIYGLK